MANKQIIFADRLVGLGVHNGLVRLDLAVHAGTGKGKDDKPAQRLDVTTQVVMPLDAFANAVALQQKLLQGLLEREKQIRNASAATPAETPAS
jgi:hypothetical protein